MKVQNNKFILHILEAAIVIGGSGIAWWFLFQHAGGPMSWDEVQYMALSLNPAPQAHILNRYFHIYFQRLFFLVADSPLDGARLFWSFLISSSIALIYLNARLLSHGSGILAGVISVILFFSYPPLIKESGVTYADITVMMLFTLGLSIYLVYLRGQGKRTCMLVLLGVVYFLSIKSKETGLAFAIIFLGLGFSTDGRFDVGRWIKKLIFILIGMLLGQLCLMAVDWFVLGDAFFSLRFGNIKVLREFNFVGEHTHTSENWFESIFAFLNVPFWLMIISFIYRSEKLAPQEKVIWLLPFGLVGFLNISMIDGMWGAITRYYWPAVPIVVILASQFISIQEKSYINSWAAIKRFVYRLMERLPNYPGIRKITTEINPPLSPYAIILLLILVFLCLAVLLLLVYATVQFSRAYGWYLSDFMAAIIYPTVLSVLILLIMFFKRWNAALAALALVCFVLIPVCTGYGNIRDFVKDKIITYREIRFMPYIIFEDQLSCLSTGERIYFSESLYNGTTSYLGSDALNSSWMFNLYFSCDIQPSQVTVSPLLNDLMIYPYTFGYITEGDYQGLDIPSRIELEAHYNLRRHSDFDVVLLLPSAP